MAFDVSDGYVLLFGGLSQTAYPIASETWIFANDQWLNITSTAGTPPTPRYGMGMTYDAADGYVLAFGGSSFTVCPPSPNDACNDTWSFHAGTWTNLHVSPAPTPRDAMGLAYDAADGYVVLFGGFDARGFCGDTWNYSGGKWTQIASASPSQPLPREGMGMTYDDRDGYVVMFGGYDALNEVLGDTWEFAGGLWTEVSASPTSPLPRMNSMMVYDDATGTVILFGGGTYAPPAPWYDWNDTWSFTGGTWTNITAGITPAARFAGAMVYDSTDSCILLFGGAGANGGQNDTWGWCSVPPLLGLTIHVSPSVPLPGAPATFTADFRGGVAPFTYSWDFGNGTTSSSSSPQHTYSAVGYYTVRLWVNDSAAHHAYASQVVHVYVPLAAPSLVATPNPAYLAQPVNFTALETGGTPPYTYAWNFGDGGTGGNLSNITHIYTTNGPFQVELTVSDSVGAILHASLNITIRLQALIQSTASSGSPPLVVSFTGGAQGGTPPYSYSWDFGDGTPISTVQNPSHIFESPGTYTVLLTITDAEGNHATSSFAVQIGSGPSSGALALELIAGGLGFGAGTAATAAVLLRRRRKDKDSSHDEPPTKIQ